MMENAARARRWMLWAAPGMALSGLFFGTGGAAAGLGLWMGLGLLPDGKGHIQLYPKQRRMKLHRLILGYAFCVCCLAGLTAARRLLFGATYSGAASFLLLLGGIGFSLPLGAWAMRWRIRKRFSRLLTFLLLGFGLILILFFAADQS